MHVEAERGDTGVLAHVGSCRASRRPHFEYAPGLVHTFWPRTLHMSPCCVARVARPGSSLPAPSTVACASARRGFSRAVSSARTQSLNSSLNSSMCELLAQRALLYLAARGAGELGAQHEMLRQLEAGQALREQVRAYGF